MRNLFKYSFLYIFFGSLFLLFFNISIVDAGVIVRPPNNLGLVGYWSFDEGRGTQASDLSGNGNDGVLNGGAEWIGGRLGQAVDFTEGTGAEVDVSNADFGLENITASAWIKPETAADSRAPIIRVDQFYFQVYNDNQLATYWYGWNNQGYHYSTANSIEIGMWQHVAVTWEKGVGIKLYINGELDTEIPNDGTGLSTNWVKIGRETSTREYDGIIDEARIYNRALSASEIQSLYANTKSTVVGENSSNYYSDGLVAHWTFDGSTLSGTNVSDVAGESDGTLTAGPEPTLGRIGQGMLFNGTSGGVNLGNPSALQITGDQTIAMWVYPENFSARRNPFAKAYGGEGTITQETSGGLNYYYGTNGGNSGPYQGFGSSASIVLNTWNHIAIVRDLSANPMRLRWYINGAETSVANATYAAAVSGTNPAYIGQGYVSRYAGVIDDVRIYNRALSANEVRGLAGAAFGTLDVDTITGSILMERWENIGTSGSVTAIPTEDPPDHTELISSFEIPVNWGDGYGVRLRGYLHPPETGDYTFWISSDNGSQLWLSANNNLTNKVLIIDQESHVSPRTWNTYPSQQSSEVPLVAGKKYYIEALMKEGGGGDNLSVSWKLNDTNPPANGSGDFIIQGESLSPWAE